MKSHLAQADKNIFYTYLRDVGRVATSLRETMTETKDRELKGYYRRLAEDLEHSSSDLADTVSRL